MLGMLTSMSDDPGFHAVCAALPRARSSLSGPANAITVFLCGDVMIGRGAVLITSCHTPATHVFTNPS
jgi:hypothetical protein